MAVKIKDGADCRQKNKTVKTFLWSVQNNLGNYPKVQELNYLILVTRKHATQEYQDSPLD